MAKPYWIDLRERVVSAVMQGAPQRFGTAPAQSLRGCSAGATTATSSRVRRRPSPEEDRRCQLAGRPCT